ncbi:helical backbone metal receptor [Propionimicrobium sp. PCR01-08-3]|uniref:helical backbone metal receptor n=1 Tax=Propionimicrobium sp. PCR01-08-3 TaxID=3052086 RepID=UPI00255C833A|nr:helical backbone metal receptor [Propionimicrobium sp. PCR01-08-3]WIY82734.1 helical backbone metal receptor [Propionimicrobium sp. PCR01-08-3]
MFDDLGAPVDLSYPPRRVVSLVPSLTEAIALSVPGVLVGATDWCVRPPGLQVERVRGTKNPDLAKIRALEPDLVVVNEEENRKLDVERLRASGVDVWVTKIDSVDEAVASLERFFTEALGLKETPAWLRTARKVWDVSGIDSEGPAFPPSNLGRFNAPTARPSTQLSSPATINGSGLRVAIPIWRDPWIWVGAGTYASDLVSRLGWTSAGADFGERYPHADVAEVLHTSGGVDAVLLPDEPYAFGPYDGPDAFPETHTVLVPGRSLFWYGPAMCDARQALEAAVRS